MRPSTRVAVVLSLTTAGVATAAALGSPAGAVVRPVSAPSIVASFNPAAGENPENLVAAGQGYVDATLNQAGRVVRISPAGAVSTLAQLPKGARAMGITRTPAGRLFVSVGGNVPALQGIWEVSATGPAVRVAALPSPGFPNGLSSAADGTLYVADSAAGTVYRLAPGAVSVTVWLQAPVLAPARQLGVNGVKVHHDALGDAVYVSNTDAGTLIRIEVRPDGSAGGAVVRAKGIASFDDFTFVPGTDTVVAAQNATDTVSLISPAGRVFPVLARSDGLAGPTSVSATPSQLLVTNADYFRAQSPELLRASLAPLPAGTRR